MGMVNYAEKMMIGKTDKEGKVDVEEVLKSKLSLVLSTLCNPKFKTKINIFKKSFK